MSEQLGKHGPEYDLRAHQELSRAFPALAERLKPLLLTEIEIECPHGHKLKVIAQLVAAGRDVFCPECRQAFHPHLDPTVEVPEAFRGTPSPDGAPPNARHEADGGLARQGLARIAEGAGLLLRAAGGPLFGRKSLPRRLLKRTGGLLTSSIFHAILLLVAMMLGVNLEPIKRKPELPLLTDVTREAPKEIFEERKSRGLFTKVHTNVQPLEVPLPELPDARPPEAQEDIPEEKPLAAPGRKLPLEDISDIPEDLITAPGVRGVMGLGSTVRPGAYTLRGDKGARLKAAKRGGGGPDTESAVERALAWLHRNRNAGGFWDSGGEDETRSYKGYRPAITAFALLAFLGAGYTHKGGHKYGEDVRKGLEWLVKHQSPDGSFSAGSVKCGYTQGVVTLALAEAIAMSGGYSSSKGDFDRKLRTAAQKGVDFAVKSQNPYAGWDYRPRGGESDISITVWNCMALKSARFAGLKVDGSAFQGIVNWLNRAQYLGEGQGQGSKWAGGRFAYRSRGKRLYRRGRLQTVMHPAGLMMRIMTGTSRDRREAFGPANLLLTLAPRQTGKQLSEEQLREMVEAFVRKRFMLWESLDDDQRARLTAEAETAVVAFPRTPADYVKRYYGSRWERLTEGQRGSAMETARRAVASYPKTAEEYIDGHYRRWKTFTAEQKKKQRAYARRVIERDLYGKGFPRSIYFLYHSSLALFQMGGGYWKAWNPHMKRELLSSQARDGADDGSWSPRPGLGMCYCRGKTMSTALGAMTLEVYYRYLRIYDKK